MHSTTMNPGLPGQRRSGRPRGPAAYQGELGQTKRDWIIVTGRGGRTFQAQVCTQINVSTDPSLRQSLLDGSLNAVADPFSGGRYALAIPVLYHDETAQLFALVLPDSLRHEEIRLRRELLERLERTKEPLPAYIRNFNVVFDRVDLDKAEEACLREQSPKVGSPLSGDLADRAKSLDAKEQQIKAEQQKLSTLKLSLEDRALRLKEAEAHLTERLEAEQSRTALPTPNIKATVPLSPVVPMTKPEAKAPEELDTNSQPQIALNALDSGPPTPLEIPKPVTAQIARPVQKSLEPLTEPLLDPLPDDLFESQPTSVGPSPLLKKAPEAPKPAARKEKPREETTMVVSMDMFYDQSGEPLNPDDKEEEPSPLDPGLARSILDEPESDAWSTGLEAGWSLGDQKGKPPASDTGEVPRSFNRFKASSRSYYHSNAAGIPVLAYRLTDDRMRAFVAQPTRVYLQLHELGAFPLVVVLLVAHGSEEEVTDDIYWPLDVRKPADRRLLRRLSEGFELQIALYGEDLKLRQILAFEQELDLNARHVMTVAELRLKEGEGEAQNFEQAIRLIEAPDYERLGGMRHNFKEDSFESLSSPSETRLAAGIVGYWSSPEMFRYLIENRSFSLGWFARIQERVVSAAFLFGIALSLELGQVAVEMELAADRTALLKAQASAWAQVSLGLGKAPNDLDPIGSWENWQDLIDALGNESESLDADLDELAKDSLRRAQNHAQEQGLMSNLTPSLERYDVSEDALELSESDALKDMLSIPHQRLTAARSILKRGDNDLLVDVLSASEHMSSEEFDNISELLSRRADHYEDALLDCIALPNPAIVLLCAMALSSLRSAKAYLPLLEALQDPIRAPDAELLAVSMAMYGTELTDDLLLALLELGDGIDETHPLVIFVSEIAAAEGEVIYDIIESDVPAVVECARERDRQRRSGNKSKSS